jgi:hypothetical protein
MTRFEFDCFSIELIDINGIFGIRLINRSATIGLLVLVNCEPVFPISYRIQAI